MNIKHYNIHISLPVTLLDVAPATLTVVHLSPTALSHTWQHCRHARLDRRFLQGCIRLHKLYSMFLQPVSLYAATITSYHICFNCSHSCEILCIPMFYGWLFPQTFPISSFALWYPFKHLRVFFFFLFSLPHHDQECISFFWPCWPLTCAVFTKTCEAEGKVVVAVRREAHQTQWERLTAKPTSPPRKTVC